MTTEKQENSRKTDPEILPLLTIKFYVPPVRANIVQRTRLVQQIESGITSNYKLTLVSAPAGFGKTTLISAWGNEARIPIAWVSLDSGDNDITRFFGYCIAALRTIKPNIGDASLELQQSPHPPAVETVLTSLINELDEIQEHFALVLDDYHVIESHPVHEAVNFLINHMPRKMHLIIATRADLPLPIARLRTRVRLTEISEFELRFTLDEAAIYLNDVMQLDLAMEDIAALENRTEGWIAGLQMTALSIQGRGDASGLARALSGKHRFVFDYLMEEVLSQQSAEVQDFMEKTSILNQLSAPICDALMGWSDASGDSTRKRTVTKRLDTALPSQEILEHMDRENLFLIPLDDERRWYRYHRLFADLLEERLVRVHGDHIQDLHRRAGDWYEQNGLIGEAINHFLEAGEFERAAEFISKNALTFVYHGNLGTLARWLEILPKDVKESQPWLSITHAWALSFAGQLEPVASLLQEAEGSLSSITDEIEVQRLSGIIDALRAYLIAIRGSMPLAADFAREALKVLPDEDLVLRGFTATLLATVLRWTGDLKEAKSAYQEAIAINRAAGATNVLVESLCDLAILQSIEGELQQSISTCHEALSLAEECYERSGRRLSAHGHVSIQLCRIFRDRNDLDLASKYAEEGLALCVEWGQAESLMRAYIEHAEILQAFGDSEGSIRSIQKARQLASDLSPWYEVRSAAWEAHLRLLQGDLTYALEWLNDQDLITNDEFEFQDFETHLTIVHTLIMHGRQLPKSESFPPLNQAIEILEQMRSTAESSGAGRYRIEIMILTSMAQSALGEAERALSTLSKALTLAEPEAFIRVFVDGGEPVRALLCELEKQNTAMPYTRKVLQSMGDQEDVGIKAKVGSTESLIDPLTEREMEVLRLLATHLSSTEIAGQLVIATSTVRSHIKNIYSKLRVHSRTETVEKAREIGLL
ncbi:MAG: LuxR C-terminal-related transcriptional regulator [Chloroflexota bacterium]|nr:LuxR C-terminal-related transcriptional regulator [Chloroflexota bacterium]